MDASELLGRGVRFPPRIVNGQWAWSVGEENIQESIYIILMTELRERLERPGFGAGISSKLFEPNILSTHQQLQLEITRALERWERRIRLVAVTVTSHPNEPREATITIVYRLVATNVQDELNFQMNLGNG
jgi:phage baseplate assembly protein W